MNKQEAAVVLGISKRQVERWIRRGKLKCSHDANGVVVIDRADLGLPEPVAVAVPEPEPAPQVETIAPPAPEPAMSLAQQIEELECWTTPELEAARLVWLKPADAEHGCMTNTPDIHSKNQPTPDNAALFARAGAILSLRAATGMPPVRRRSTQLIEVSRDCSNHNSNVSGVGSPETFEYLWKGRTV
jgi:hypothetical protein